MMPQTALPTGTITFLFTDIEGSTKLWETQPAAMQSALARHDVLLKTAIHGGGGVVFKTIGDAFCAAFASAPAALDASVAAQRALFAEPWQEAIPVLRVRMALHTGTVEERDNDYFGPPVNRVARLLSAGHGGQTLVSAASYELVRDRLPDGVGLLDLGLHRLKDLERPEHVFQVSAPGLPDTFAALRTLDTTPNNLPQQLTSFIGREKVIADATALLAKTRLLTLTASGGAGKTRLSLQVAADVLDAYSDGAWQVELAPLSDLSLVPQAVASVLGVKEQAGQTVTQTLTGWLKDKTLLLVLDNCEHLLGSCAQLSAALLRACPGVKILATSREPLGIGGETTYRVPSLSLPSAAQAKAASVESLSHFEAVRLFIERAQAVKPDFNVTSSNAPALAQLCLHLDGIPLAIELAAARVRSLAVEQINDKLDSRFRLLTGGDRSALPRQQTLRALVDWSYDLLTDTEKTLFARLSVFAGGWTLEAAEAVCGFEPIEDWEVLDLLTSLSDKSLFIADADADAGKTRYRLLETLKQYGSEKLMASGEEKAVRKRHIDFFVALAEEASPQVRGAQQGQWLNRLEDEHDNLRAALDRCAASVAAMAVLDQTGAADQAEALSGLRLAQSLGGFWKVRGYYTEGREQLSRALLGRNIAVFAASPPEKEAGAQSVVAGVLLAAGEIAIGQCDYASARRFLEESLASFRKLDNAEGIANALNNLGVITIILGDSVGARLLFEESLQASRKSDFKLGIANALSNIGNVAYAQADYATAKRHYEEGLQINRSMGDKYGIANTLNNLGNVAHFQRDYVAAWPLLEESLQINREIGRKQGIANALNNLAGVASSAGDYAVVPSLIRECLSLYRELGFKQGVAASLDGLASVWVNSASNTQGAVVLLGACDALRQSLAEKLPLDDQAKMDSSAARAKAELGEAAFFAAWNEGRALSMEQAIDYALLH